MGFASKPTVLMRGLVPVLLALAACGGPTATAESPAFSSKGGVVTIHRQGPVKFATAAAALGSPLPAPSVTARVLSVESLTSPVFAPLEGRVVMASVRLGDHVTQGQRLVEIRSSELPVLHSQLEAAQAAQNVKAAEVERLQQLVEARTGSQHDLMVAQGELEALRIASRTAAARVKSLEITTSGDASYFAIAARAGTVIQLEAPPGLVVGPERSVPLATVASIDEVVVVGDLPVRDATSITVGAPARVRVGDFGGHELTGTVELVSDVVDAERQTVPVRVRLQNPNHVLKPNAFVELIISPDTSQSLVLVPSQAVVTDGAQSVVFVEQSPGHFERREVQVGRRSAEQAEVRAGLSAGTKVVTSHALLLLNALDAEG
jgi:cobalt-zinc-cadmium efflux system membrane fusion protein